MLSLPSAWTYEKGFPNEAGISELWDTSVLVINGTCIDTVCSFLPQYGPGEHVSVPGCFTNTNHVTSASERPEYGSRMRTGLTGRDFGYLGGVYAITPQTKIADQSVIQGMFLLFHLLEIVLFYSCASHSFISSSYVNVLGLKVESLEKSLHVSSPLGTMVSVDLICRECEIEVSGILLTMDLRVMDMSEFDVILEMD